MIDEYVEKVLNGDKNAYKFVVNAIKDEAFSIAVSIVKDENDAQEIVQKTFVKAYLKLNTFKADSSFSTWFHRILINEAFYRRRKQTRQKKSLEKFSDQVSKKEINNTLSKLDEDFQRYYINKALSELSSKHSLVMILFYLKEYKISEICEVTGWTESNIKVILHRARKEMKQVLNHVLKVDKEELY
jgi:RNA polymerase sigma-70 factor (ECF subfamily)